MGEKLFVAVAFPFRLDSGAAQMEIPITVVIHRHDSLRCSTTDPSNPEMAEYMIEFLESISQRYGFRGEKVPATENR
jgi:hypothetical protein